MKANYIFFASLFIFTTLLFLLPVGFISSDLGNAILTISTFLFGIMAGFYIVITTTDYNSVKSILASETAALISLYQNVLIYDKQSAEKLSLLIDEYVRNTLNYEIINYVRNTHRQFQNIQSAVRDLPIHDNLSSVYESIRNDMSNFIIARQQLTVLGAKTLSIFQWVVIFVLALIPLVSLYGLRTGEIFFDIVTVIVSVAVALILVLIRDLDLYVWNEKTFSFEIFENVFIAIGQLPFYPAESIRKGRVRPTENEYRLGTYVDFPRTLERKIEVIK